MTSRFVIKVKINSFMLQPKQQYMFYLYFYLAVNYGQLTIIRPFLQTLEWSACSANGTYVRYRNLIQSCQEDIMTVKYITSHHIISYHIISYHIISYHIISYHIISYHIISYRIVSYHIYYHISYYIISYRIVSYHITYIHCAFFGYNKKQKRTRCLWSVTYGLNVFVLLQTFPCWQEPSDCVLHCDKVIYCKGWERWLGCRLPQYYGQVEELFLPDIECTWG
jgi:hypothetical protein